MDFVFVTCQVGAEPAVKAELAREHPELHFAFSRPGFLTFKFAGPHLPLAHFRLRSVFSRAWGFSLGKIPGPTAAERAVTFQEMLADHPVTEFHVWERDQASPREQVPVGRTPAAAAAEAAIRAAVGERPPSEGDRLIADCVLVEPDEWWAGWHVARTVPEHWPGGQLLDPLPEHAVSRGFLKMREMLLWSELRVNAGDACVEIGCSPGGASQQLLTQGLQVAGIDPADVHPVVLASPRFTHVRARPKDLKKKLFRGIPWLVCDVNLPPRYTLDTVEEIVRYPGVRFRGMLLTLKLPEWSLAEEIPEHVARVQGWGYSDIRVRQLHQNRQEICLAAQELP